MRNSEIMSLELSRLDMCDLSQAVLSVLIEMDTELNNKNTTDYRREVLRASMPKWERLQDEINKQIYEFDHEYYERYFEEV